MISASDGTKGSPVSSPPIVTVASIVDDEAAVAAAVDADFASLSSGCIFTESFFPSSTRSSGHPGRSDCTIRRDTNGTSFPECQDFLLALVFDNKMGG
jgi:hypothetical protein